jgi:hypothetical protein
MAYVTLPVENCLDIRTPVGYRLGGKENQQMAKQPPRQGKPWTPKETRQLRELAAGNTPTPLAAWKLGRSVDAVRSKASEKEISLKPTNKSPYNRQDR